MSTGTFYLVKFNDRNKLIPAIESFSDNKNITHWDAVDGHYNIVLLATSDISKQLESLEGFDEMDRCEIKSNSETKPNNPDLVYSYVYIETAKEKKDSILKRLGSLESFALCCSTSGSFDIIAMLSGETFNNIDQTINNEIRNLDGVLRLKQDHVIYLDRI